MASTRSPCAPAASSSWDIDPKHAAERLWLLTSSELYLLAVDDLGWSPASYQRWLTSVLERELLAGADD